MEVALSALIPSPVWVRHHWGRSWPSHHLRGIAGRMGVSTPNSSKLESRTAPRGVAFSRKSARHPKSPRLCVMRISRHGMWWMRGLFWMQGGDQTPPL